MRILIVEHSDSRARKIRAAVKNDYRDVTIADCAEEGISLAKHFDFDILLVSSKLDEGTGITFMRNVRIAKVKTPIIIVGENKPDLHVKVSSLGLGADDFITLGTHPDEIGARIEAVVRRTKGFAYSVIECGKLSVNIDQKDVSVDGIPVHLTAQEFRIVELLAMRSNKAVTKEAILDHMGKGELDEPEIKTVDVHICKIRKKLAAAGAPEVIKTVRGIGYTVSSPSNLVQAAARFTTATTSAGRLRAG